MTEEKNKKSYLLRNIGFQKTMNKKILMISATPYFSERGCHIRIFSEMKYLKRAGFNVRLCTYHLGGNPDNLDVKRILNVFWYKKTSPGPSWHKIYLDFFLLILSIKEVILFRPKVIHAHLYEGLVVSLFAKLFSFSGAKIIFDCQGSLSEEMERYTLHKNWFYRSFINLFVFLERFLLLIPSHIVCSSSNVRKYLISKFDINENKISVLDDAIDWELFGRSVDNVDSLEKKVSIPPGNSVIFYSGSISHGKGVKELMDAIPAILNKKKNITFVFIGFGELLGCYKNKLNKEIISGNVIFIGRVSYFKLPKLLSIVDFCIEPKKESTEASMKSLIYMTQKLPIICFRNKFNESLLGEAGVYINSFEEISNLEIKKRKVEYGPILDWKDNIQNLIKKYDEISR